MKTTMNKSLNVRLWVECWTYWKSEKVLLPYKWSTIEYNSVNTGNFGNILWSNSKLPMWSNSKDWKTGYFIKNGPTEKFLQNKRSAPISGLQLKIKIKLWHNTGPSEKILWNHRKFCERSTIKYDTVNYGVKMDLQKNSFTKPAKSCPHWLDTTLRKELGRLAQKYRIAI